MDGEEKEKKDTLEDIVDSNELKKSFNASLAKFKAEIKSDITDELRKAKKEESKEEEEGEEEDEEGEGENEEDLFYEEKKGKGKMKKSLFDEMEEDEETQVSLDASPFLKSLAKGVDRRFASLEKKMNSLMDFTAKTGELQKSLFDQIEILGNTPEKKLSLLRKSKDRFDGKDGKTVIADKQDAMRKVLILRKSGAIGDAEVITAESRLNKGLELDTRLTTLIKSIQ